MVAKRDWAWLTDLPLNLVILKLPCLPDCVRFSTVCTSWRRAARNACQKQFSLPMLLFPTTDSSGGHELFLYSVQEKRSYYIVFPFLRGGPHLAKLCGYSLGWLAVVETDLTIILFRPSPKDRPQLAIRLPPIMDALEIPKGLLPRMPSKIILSADPITSRRYVAAAVNEFSHILQIDGGNLLTGKVVARALKIVSNYHINLVESGEGKLLVIQSNLSSPPCPIPNTTHRAIKVFEAELTGGKGLDGEATDIGGGTLFIGDNCSVAVSGSDYNSGIKDCVCYTNDNVMDCEDNPTASPNDICVFSLEEPAEIPETYYTPTNILCPPIGTSAPFFDQSNYCPPIWFTPVLSDDWV